MTPGGKLTKGDKLTNGSGIVYVVVERVGNDALYSVRLKRQDGKPVDRSGNMTFLLVNAASWIGRGYELV